MSQFRLNRAEFLRGLGASAALAVAPGAWASARPARTGAIHTDRAEWHLGPFLRSATTPVLKPDPNAVFDDPMHQRPDAWMSAHTFNPASVVRDGKMVVLFRAEDRPDEKMIGFHTSRLGYASSDDGLHFTYRPTPVLYPDKDDQQHAEWDGGCEDPRLCEGPDGTYYVTYTQWNHDRTRLGIASSRDLIHWQKHGSAFAGTAFENLSTKSAAIIQRIDGGRMKAALINGAYWMVFGEGLIHIARSTDLIHWSPVVLPNGEPMVLMAARPSLFDSELPEVGPPPLVTERGIVMLYNGKNSENDAYRDRSIGPGAYSGGQALLDLRDPTKLLARSTVPFIKPELPWEKSGQYQAGTTFLEGLSYFKGRFYLYYGTADTYVGVAVAPAPAWVTRGAAER
ncbi:MAG: putative GH43/DUF377 family glycosyl hydrolase [Sphingomonas echinoides]|jgi:predicted GH43/DUF377 family glycosyl hydrolase|uniref:glycoside hydrolase family 130 protein n=2 Tax=Sphingomonas TaxID=13687 RepID=UPI001AE97B8A